MSSGQIEYPTKGTQFVMLDSVRDASFLGQNGADFGLGVTDNPLFVFTTYSKPGSPNTRRPYPFKLFWLGSPAGTNDLTDVFSIYVADIAQEFFAPGAIPSTGPNSWLVNPRLVIPISQAKADIINWFDSNYPGGAAGGVGLGNTGSNSAYGTLWGGTSSVGNISGTSSIDGQFWPIYDRIDDSFLIYFSVKTPNENTLSIYCYKFTDSELSVPAGQSGTSATFLGGMSPTAVGLQTPLSSHRFSILSPDPLLTFGKVSGQQAAVLIYSFYAFDGTTPDHGANVIGSILQDIHSKPTTPVSQLKSNTAYPDGYYPVDKLGSIVQCPSTDAPDAGYVCIYNAPSLRDQRNSLYSNHPVVISAMQIRTLYFNPAIANIAFGSTPLRSSEGLDAMGTCRPQFTHFPDGLPKLLYANFTSDQYLNLGYEYIASDALSPYYQDKIVLGGNATLGAGSPAISVYAWGKRKMKLVLYSAGNPTNNPSPTKMSSMLLALSSTTMDPTNGTYGNNSQEHSLIPLDQTPILPGYQVSMLEARVEDIPVFLRLYSLGSGGLPIGSSWTAELW